MNDKRGNHLTTSQLLTFIRKSNSFEQVSDFFHENDEQPVFCHFLYELMGKHKMTPKDMINSSGIERSYFYHILSGQKTPSRNIVLRLALCLGATLQETNQLLRLSHQGALYAKIRRDAAIIFAIEKKYTMQQTNEFLLREHEQVLYREDFS